MGARVNTLRGRVRFRDGSLATLATRGLRRYALERAMTKHRPSTLESFTLGPAPAIELSEKHAGPRPISVTCPEGAYETIEATGASPAPSHARRSMRKRIAALLAVIAVPAMAAPGDFGAMPGDAAPEAVEEIADTNANPAMAFEQSGMSFPGSAFFYVADPADTALVALPESNPEIRGAVGGRNVGSLIDAGPAASAFLAGTGANYLRAADCLAQAVWYEAASESEAGQRAVAQVVLNRVAHPSWPSSVCGVVYEGSQRSTGCQFTFTCDGSLVRRSPGTLRGASWERAQRIAGEALNGSVYAAIGHATHYHTLWVDPYWAKTLDPVGVIGAHRFYRNRGSVGEKAAFNAGYNGIEPAVSGRKVDDLAGAGDAGPSPDGSTRIEPRAVLETAEVPSPIVPPIVDSAPAPQAPQAGDTRKEYARAGQWKVDPRSLGLKPQSKDEEADGTSEKSEGEPSEDTPKDLPLERR